MESEQHKDKVKLSYQKPRLRIIELAAEEVLFIGCKQTATGNAIDSGGPGEISCTLATTCVDAGS